MQSELEQGKKKKSQGNKFTLFQSSRLEKIMARTQAIRTEKIIFYLKKIFRKLICWAYTLIYCKEGGMRSIWS